MICYVAKDNQNNPRNTVMDLRSLATLLLKEWLADQWHQTTQELLQTHTIEYCLRPTEPEPAFS